MPTVFGHAALSLAGGLWYAGPRSSRRFLALTMVCGLLPDADVAAFHLGISYEHVFGHRGFFHSLTFALLVGVAAALWYRRSWRLGAAGWRLALFFGAVTASHGLTDALTNGGLGIALLSPWETTRFFFPWTPIQVSPLGIRSFFSPDGLAAVVSELRWICLPAAGMAWLGWRRPPRAVAEDA
ncbi:MAG: metal-dependent hydrolase [Magnetococcales bacterium]|nr:metal-dependent hydrolase [Magnetococcales bacterium]